MNGAEDFTDSTRFPVYHTRQVLRSVYTFFLADALGVLAFGVDPLAAPVFPALDAGVFPPGVFGVEVLDPPAAAAAAAAFGAELLEDPGVLALEDEEGLLFGWAADAFGLLPALDAPAAAAPALPAEAAFGLGDFFGPAFFVGGRPCSPPLEVSTAGWTQRTQENGTGHEQAQHIHRGFGVETDDGEREGGEVRASATTGKEGRYGFRGGAVTPKGWNAASIYV